MWENRGGNFEPLWSDSDGGSPTFGVAMAAGDIDADGDIDFVVNYATGGVVAYVNDGTGHFTRSPRANEIGDQWTELKLCDLDGDNYPELLGIRQNTTPGDNDGGAVVVLRNNHDTTFGVTEMSGRGGASLSLAVAEPGTPTTVACADIDQDGHVDIISNSFDGYQLLIWRGHGALVFDATPSITPIDVQFGGLSIADFDRDGDLDIGSSAPYQNEFVVYPNTNGQIGSPVRSSSGNTAMFGGFADFNGDCYPDYYTASQDNCYISVSLNDTKGGFLPPTRYSTGGRAYGVAAGDLDNDGDVDLAVATKVEYSFYASFPGQIAILRNRGNGKFWAPVAYDAPDSPKTVAAADFNNDGIKDLVVVRTFYMSSSATGDYGIAQTLASMDGGDGMGATSVATPDLDHDGQADLIIDGNVFFSNHQGDFTAGWSNPIQAPVYNMAVGNLNNDAWLDWVLLNLDSDIIVYLGAENVTFDNPFSFRFTGPLSMGAVALADMNADGLDDIIASVYLETNPGVLVALNQGDGHSYDATLYASAAPAFGLAVADFNGDKVLDVAVTTCDQTLNVPGKIAVFRGDGTGALSKPQTFDSVTCPTFLAAGDLDGDGDIDLAASLNTPHNYLVEVLPNDGTGAFPGHQVLVAGDAPYGIIVSDLDSDGDLDIVTANYSAYTATILRNEVLTEDPRANHPPLCHSAAQGGASGSGGATATFSTAPASGGVSSNGGGSATGGIGGDAQSSTAGTRTTGGYQATGGLTGEVQSGGASASGGAPTANGGSSRASGPVGGTTRVGTSAGGLSSLGTPNAQGGNNSTSLQVGGKSSVIANSGGATDVAGSGAAGTLRSATGGATVGGSTLSGTAALGWNGAAGATVLGGSGTLAVGTTAASEQSTADGGCACRVCRGSRRGALPVASLLGLALVLSRRRANRSASSA